jgi:hypothetical protein
VCLLAALPADRAGRQEPTFRSATRTVPVYVTVADADGRLVPDLGRGDFELDSTGDLGATFAGVADVLRRKYAMGCSPERLDGKVHTLDVRIKRPGMTARARRSCVATPAR